MDGLRAAALHCAENYSIFFHGVFQVMQVKLLCIIMNIYHHHLNPNLSRTSSDRNLLLKEELGCPLIFLNK